MIKLKLITINGITATSSGLTTPESCVNNKAVTASLINQGYNEIEKEIALGDCEYLRALASLNKTSSQTETQYILSLRDEFSIIIVSSEYSSKSHFNKAENLFNIVIK